jgi:hypothetical protein
MIIFLNDRCRFIGGWFIVARQIDSIDARVSGRGSMREFGGDFDEDELLQIWDAVGRHRLLTEQPNRNYKGKATRRMTEFPSANLISTPGQLYTAALYVAADLREPEFYQVTPRMASFGSELLSAVRQMRDREGVKSAFEYTIGFIDDMVEIASLNAGVASKVQKGDSLFQPHILTSGNTSINGYHHPREQPIIQVTTYPVPVFKPDVPPIVLRFG